MSNKVILLVEDNEDDEIMTVHSLRDGGYQGEIVIARDGQEAVDWLFSEGEHSSRNPDAVPAVVLLDIRLPKLSGFEVLSAIRRRPESRHVPVVMLTASSEQEDMVRSYELRANSYVRKPVSIVEFRKVMHSLGVYWTEYNQCP
jgi:two-component system, response regulator